MKLWEISMADDHPHMQPIFREFSWEGVAKFNKVLRYCLDTGLSVIDAILIKNLTHSNIRGASKLLPLFQETLMIVLPKIRQSLTKVSGKFPQSLPKLEYQNPVSEGLLLEENKRELEQEEISLPPTPSVEERETADPFLKKALDYLSTQAANDPNFQNISFAKGYLGEQFKNYVCYKRSSEAVYKCWTDAVDSTFSRNKGISYLKITFQNKLEEWVPNRPALRAVTGAGVPNRQQGMVLSKVIPASERVAGVSQP